jgi:polyferredoxin
MLQVKGVSPYPHLFKTNVSWDFLLKEWLSLVCIQYFPLIALLALSQDIGMDPGKPELH